jgi:ATP-dependent Clp protease ATP-binding subunit ClpC
MDWFDFAEDHVARWKARDAAARSYRKKFTPAALAALDTALAEARSQGFDAIGAEHLLLGLAQVREGNVPKVFADSRLSVEFLRWELKITKKDDPGKSLAKGLNFTPRMKAILRTAGLEAQGRGVIDAENLLMALVRQNEGMAATLLRKLGIVVEVLEKRFFGESASI